MTDIPRSRLRFGTAVTALGLIAGCATFELPAPVAEDVAPARESRQQAVMRDFQRRRNAAQWRAAITCWNQGDAAGCRALLEPVLQASPEHHAARRLLADACLAQGDLAAAQQQFEVLLEQQPGDAAVQHSLGLLLESSDRRQEAADHFYQAVLLEPHNPLYVASAERTAAPATATSAASSGMLQQLTPPLPPAVASPTGAPRHTVGGRSDPADQGAAAGSGPGRQRAPVQKALASVSPDDRQERVRLLKEATSAEPSNPHIPLAAAAQLLQTAETDAAIELLTHAVTVHTRSAALFRMLGAAYFAQHQYPASLRALEESLSLDNSSALAYFLVGCSLAETGQVEAAGQHFATAHRLDPRYPDRR